MKVLTDRKIMSQNYSVHLHFLSYWQCMSSKYWNNHGRRSIYGLRKFDKNGQSVPDLQSRHAEQGQTFEEYKLPLQLTTCKLTVAYKPRPHHMHS